jgi:hypothetical protein
MAGGHVFSSFLLNSKKFFFLPKSFLAKGISLEDERRKM